MMYNEFIVYEKSFSEKFLKTQQILDERFNEDEYILIKHAFDDVKMIDTIYEVIDSIVKDMGFERKSRFLIIGDFLSTMFSFDIRDPANIILKISRNDYIRKIMTRAEINSVYGYDFLKYIEMHKKLLVGLRHEKVIERCVVKIKKDDWSTIIYFKLITKDFYLEDISPVGRSDWPFMVSLNKKYSIGSFRNIWKIKRKKKEMEDVYICNDSIIRANSIQLELKIETYDINKKTISDELSRTLEGLNCKDCGEYFTMVKKLSNDRKYSYDLFIDKDDEMFEKRMGVKNEFIEIMKKYQKILSFKILERTVFRKHYLPCFMDNRGRQYYATIMSPTFYNLFRHLYSFVEKKNFFGLEDSTFYKKVIKFKNLLKEFNLDDRDSYIAIVLLIEIGKFYIKTDDKCFIKTEEIIRAGLKNYLCESELEFKDKLYVNKIRNTLFKLINNEEIDINTIIFKDATASGLQNYGIILGYKEDKLSYLNLDGDDWCDTYKIIIEKFLKGKTELLKRSYWKSTIMTIPYNAVWFSCFKKFIMALKKDGIDYRNMGIKEKDELKKIHREFYENIKKHIKGEFFVKEKAELFKFQYNEYKVVSKHEYKINYKRSRDKYTSILYMIIEDKKNTEKASEANNVHYWDAILIKYIYIYFDILPIHDCIGMRLCEIHLIMDKINNYYSEKIGKKTYCMHVII